MRRRSACFLNCRSACTTPPDLRIGKAQKVSYLYAPTTMKVNHNQSHNRLERASSIKGKKQLRKDLWLDGEAMMAVNPAKRASEHENPPFDLNIG
jgi:hypothetical protein